MTSFSLTLDEIYALAHEALLGAGANEEQADAVANVVTRAERDGSHSHGLFRIPSYAPLSVIMARLQKVSRLAGVHCRVVKVEFGHPKSRQYPKPTL